MAKVAVLGGGAFGLTLADLLACKNHKVSVWMRNPEKVRQISASRTPGKPPSLVLHHSVMLSSDLVEACYSADVILFSVASSGLRSVCESLHRAINISCERLYVNVAKGIEDETLFLPSQVFRDVLGDACLNQFTTLSGPSLAEEVCRGIPTVVASCSSNLETAGRVQELFFRPTFRVYTNTDLPGVELGGALKNVLAVAAGICDGLGFGANTKSALITRGLAELTRAGVALGAKPETLYGLAGLGDLVTTSMSPLSRNRTFGELIGKGMPSSDALANIGAVVEGYHSSRAAYQLSRRLDIETPITDAVHAVLHLGQPIQQAMEALLGREPKAETTA